MKYVNKQFHVSMCGTDAAAWDRIFAAGRARERQDDDPDTPLRRSACGCDNRECPRCRAEDNE